MNTARSAFRLAALALLACASLGFAQTTSPRRLSEKDALPYRITRGDVLAVAVFGEPDLTGGNKKVEAKGTINLPLIQEIRVTNLTVTEAQKAIEDAYRDQRFLRNPQVTITIENYAQRIVIVNGKVNQPGRYELPPDQQWTIKDIISKANGFAETAKGTDVRVQRTMPDGSLKTFNLDVDSYMRGKSNSKTGDANFVLEPDDVIYVPERII